MVNQDKEYPSFRLLRWCIVALVFGKRRSVAVRWCTINRYRGLLTFLTCFPFSYLPFIDLPFNLVNLVCSVPPSNPENALLAIMVITD